MLIRSQGGEVELITEEGKQDKPNFQKLMIIRAVDQNQQAFTVSSCSSSTVYEEANDKVWSVIGSTGQEAGKITCKLNRGDIVKLGRVQIKVKDYRICASTKDEDKIANLQEDGPIDVRICNDQPKLFRECNLN
jgi:hypothetical protein